MAQVPSGIGMLMKSFGLDPAVLTDGVAQVQNTMAEIATALTDIRASVHKQETMAQVHALEIERLAILVTQLGKEIRDGRIATVGGSTESASILAARSHERNGSAVSHDSAGEGVSGQMGAGTRSGDPAIPAFLDRRGSTSG
jgi:methyl-accepting chemotaxis protein